MKEYLKVALALCWYVQAELSIVRADNRLHELTVGGSFSGPARVSAACAFGEPLVRKLQPLSTI